MNEDIDRHLLILNSFPLPDVIDLHLIATSSLVKK